MSLCERFINMSLKIEQRGACSAEELADFLIFVTFNYCCVVSPYCDSLHHVLSPKTLQFIMCNFNTVFPK